MIKGKSIVKKIVTDNMGNVWESSETINDQVGWIRLLLLSDTIKQIIIKRADGWTVDISLEVDKALDIC